MPPGLLAAAASPCDVCVNTTPGVAVPNYQLSIFEIGLPCIWHLAGGQEPLETNWKSNDYKIRRWIWVGNQRNFIFSFMRAAAFLASSGLMLFSPTTWVSVPDADLL